MPPNPTTARAVRVALAAHALPALLLAVLAGFLFRALLSPAGFVTHEGGALYLRTGQYLHELAAGRFPHVLFTQELGGAGYAFPLFYPPLAFWFAAAWSALAGDVVWGTNLSLFAAVLLSGWACYGAAVACGASRWLALGAAVVYLAAPYRLLDVFVRGALAESAAFLWYPLIVAGALRCVRRARLSLLLPLAVAGLLLTHAVMALWFALLALPFLVFLFVRYGRTALLPLGGALAGGLLALWQLLPAQLLMPHVRVGEPQNMWATAGQVGNHALELEQLVRADPARWFGFSPEDMSFHLGVTVAIALLALLAFIVRQRAPGSGTAEPAALGVLALVGFELAVLVALHPRPALAVLPAAFGYVQFPWRLLAHALFFAAFGAALAGASPRVPVRAHAAFALAALCAALLTPRWERTPRVRADWTGADLAAVRTTGYTGVALTVLGEYLPAGVRTDTILAALARAPELLEGAGVLTLARTADGVRLSGNVREAATVRLPLVSYPLYRATDARGERLPLLTRAGLLTLELPAGPVEVRVRRVAPAGQAGAALASALTLLLLLRLRFRRPRAPARAGAPPPDR